MVFSTQYPGYGGGATNAYAIVKALRESGYQYTRGVFFEDRADAEVDPEGIGGISRVSLYPFVWKNVSAIDRVRSQLDRCPIPILVICKDYLTPTYSKVLYPEVPIVYFIPGLHNVITRCHNISARELLETGESLPAFPGEEEAIRVSAKIVANSDISLQFLQRDYDRYAEKIHPVPINTSSLTTMGLCSPPLGVREYDFVVVASILTRPEKNVNFLLRVIEHPKMLDKSWLVVGNEGDLFDHLDTVDHYKLLPRCELLEHLTRCKVIVHPAYYDSNPNTVQEAIKLGCLPLISNNVGGSAKYPEECVVTDYQVESWVEKAIYLSTNYDLVRETFQEKMICLDCVQDLCDLVRVLDSDISFGGSFDYLSPGECVE